MKDKAHKFWYSKKQLMLFGSRTDCFPLVKTQDGWKEYTEWCSDGQDSGWDDAELIFEAEDKPEIDVNNCGKMTCGRCNMLRVLSKF